MNFSSIFRIGTGLGPNFTFVNWSGVMLKLGCVMPRNSQIGDWTNFPEIDLGHTTENSGSVKILNGSQMAVRQK